MVNDVDNENAVMSTEDKDSCSSLFIKIDGNDDDEVVVVVVVVTQSFQYLLNMPKMEILLQFVFIE
jgi:hypothetical protein